METSGARGGYGLPATDYQAPKQVGFALHHLARGQPVLMLRNSPNPTPAVRDPVLPPNRRPRRNHPRHGPQHHRRPATTRNRPNLQQVLPNNVLPIRRTLISLSIQKRSKTQYASRSNRSFSCKE